MSNNTIALVDAIIAGDTIDTKNTFQAAMGERISDHLNQLRTDLSKTMFNQSSENNNE